MKILVHICCAPCFTYPHHRIQDQGDTVVGYWFNPNIHPFMEYCARRDAVKTYAALEDVTVIYDDYTLMHYLSMIITEIEQGNNRCLACYRYRLEKTADYAKKNGFDGFTTTLLSSHHQKHNKIREIGEKIAERDDILFYYQDFREGWSQGRALSMQYSLYRQRYCGCLWSEYERYTGIKD
jgi:predicted adenine nucleotide alpha hydrolase (AANH) superfamily ATPase